MYLENIFLAEDNRSNFLKKLNPSYKLIDIEKILCKKQVKGQ